MNIYPKQDRADQTFGIGMCFPERIFRAKKPMRMKEHHPFQCDSLINDRPLKRSRKNQTPMPTPHMLQLLEMIPILKQHKNWDTATRKTKSTGVTQSIRMSCHVNLEQKQLRHYKFLS